jgi:hypothetical protein
LKIKLNGRHFDTTEVIEAESQAVLNALTEHDFHDEFNKWQKELIASIFMVENQASKDAECRR